MDILDRITQLLREEKKPMGSYYTEEEDGIWYIFHSESPKALKSYSTKREAEDKVRELNKEVNEEMDSITFNDEKKWSDIVKKKGAKKFVKDPKTGSTFATDDKGGFVGTWDSKSKTGSI